MKISFPSQIEWRFQISVLIEESIQNMAQETWRIDRRRYVVKWLY